jgi:pimeloyl-ACP methyl ester carboxylesterase
VPARVVGKHQPMIDLQKITTAPNLTFDVMIGGPDDGPPVLLLHGFAESFHTW